MSPLENSFLKAPLQTIVQLYSNEIAPRIPKNNKLVSISAAVILSLVYLIIDKAKPPRKLRHLPYISLFCILKSTYYKESVRDRCHRVHIPIIESENSNGLFLEVTRNGWVLNVANPEDAKRVLLKHELFPKINISEERSGTLQSKFTIRPSMAMSSGVQWKRQRNVANPAFHRSMPVRLFGNLTQEMFRSMENKGEVFNVSDLMERWTLDVIGRAGFGFDFNSIKTKESEWVRRYGCINRGLRDPLFFLFPRLDTSVRWLFPDRQYIHEQTEIFLKMLDEVVENKKLDMKNGVLNSALEENERDLLTLMLESGKEGSGMMSDYELKSNLCGIFLAGHDTTASALSYAIHYLAENQDIQEKARQKAISILGDESCDVLPTIEDTKRMAYINQIIKETLRINGPVARTITHVAREDSVLSVKFGAILMYNPDRFSENGEGVREAGEEMTWIPFGSGARQCIAINFSLNEQKFMLSMLCDTKILMVNSNELYP
ncbi:cytochrome P450 [Helicostylum pulchrum]|nr:cytochrome P450 [Helicostylum pulchrum]